jgi:hypothetical protein
MDWEFSFHFGARKPALSLPEVKRTIVSARMNQLNINPAQPLRGMGSAGSSHAPCNFFYPIAYFYRRSRQIKSPPF